MRAGYLFFYFLFWIPSHILYPQRNRGRKNIPDGPCVICANHSSFIDPLLIIYAFGLRYYLRCMSKQENMTKPVLGLICRWSGAYGVNRGEMDIAAVRTTLRLLQGGEKVLIFPEGTRTQTDNAEAGKTGALRFSLKTDSPVLPVFVTRDKKLFHPVRVTIGEPYRLPPEAKTQMPHYTEQLMQTIFALGEEI